MTTKANITMEAKKITREIVRNFAIIAVFVLIQFSCATKDEANHASISVEEIVRSSKSWDEKLLVAYPRGQPEITILRIRIPAGARLDTHSHPVINAGMLMSGQLTVKTTDGQVLRLKAGDPIVEVVNTLHYGINDGTVPAEIIVFYAGIVGQAITVSKQ